MLTVIDEYTRKCLAIRVGSSLKAYEVLETLSTLFITEGVPQYIRSDNGSGFTYCSPFVKHDLSWNYEY